MVAEVENDSRATFGKPYVAEQENEAHFEHNQPTTNLHVHLKTC